MKKYPLLLSDTAVHECITEACTYNRVPELICQISFEWNKRYTVVAGRAWFQDMRIVLSVPIMNKMHVWDQRETVIHETCHLIAWHLSEHIGHGQPWKKAMVLAGYVPQKFHNVQVARKSAARGPKR